MSNRWSTQFAQRYRLRLTPDLIDWFDNGWWEKEGGGEFHRPLSPEALLDPPPGLIWAGMLPADMLPLVSNDYGDLICLRAGEGESIREMAIWRHGGGDWIPCGKTLAEALLYDAVIGAPYSHQEQFHDRDDVEPAERFTFTDWAMKHLSGRGVRWPTDCSDPAWTAVMKQAGLSHECLRRDECLRVLHTPLREHRAVETARELELPWSPEFVSWQFDIERMPPELMQQLAARIDLQGDEKVVQDWTAASAEANAMISERQDLGWAWDILGWQAERTRDFPAAVSAYLNGIRTSQFTDQSLDFRTHWFDDACGKFAGWRLYELREHLPAKVVDDEYLGILIAANGEAIRRRVGEYWFAAASQAMEAGEHRVAYDNFLNAGWDVGLESREEYQQVLAGLIESAEQAGDAARCEIAKAHLAAM